MKLHFSKLTYLTAPETSLDEPAAFRSELHVYGQFGQA